MRFKLLLTRDDYGVVEVGAMEVDQAEEQPERWANLVAAARAEVDQGMEAEYGVVEAEVPDEEVRKAFARTRRARGRT